jgi:SAM-dependent methyltransferase
MVAELTYKKLKKIYNLVGERRGWDFSKMRREKEELPWDYGKVILKYLKPSDKVLDIGTGGGEFFINLAPNFSKGTGIDFDSEMIKTAKENLPEDLKNKISFKMMGAEKLDFSKESFDIVINRHAPIYPEEIDKVLKMRGYFITQQVGGYNSQNINDTFGWPSNGEYWEKFYKNKGEPSQAMENVIKKFISLNFELIHKENAKVKYWFKDIESLVFWLKSVPLPENFNLRKHWKKVVEVIEKYSTPKGIQTIQHRQIVVVRKTR